MNADLHPYTARLRVMPGVRSAPADPPSGAVLAVGYRASFATPPAPGTQVALFPTLDPAAIATSNTPWMALISVEQATQLDPTDTEGGDIAWEALYFTDRGHTGIKWHLVPVDPEPERRFVIAPGAWRPSGYQAVLTRSLIAEVPFAPIVVAVHNTNSHTGHTRW